MVTYTITKRNINNAALFEEVHEFIEGIVLNFTVTCSINNERDTILEIIDELMEDMVTDNRIDQWNVMCDRRNNKASDIWKNITVLDITYRQVNCYNTTKLHYIIKK